MFPYYLFQQQLAEENIFYLASQQEMTRYSITNFFFFLNSQKLIHRPKHMISLLISDLLLFSFLSLFLKDMSLRDTLEHPRDWPPA